MVLLHDIVFWVAFVLAFGGVFIALGGIMLVKVGRLLRFFEVNLDPSLGWKVCVLGVILSVAGFGGLYLLLPEHPH